MKRISGWIKLVSINISGSNYNAVYILSTDVMDGKSGKRRSGKVVGRSACYELWFMVRQGKGSDSHCLDQSYSTVN